MHQKPFTMSSIHYEFNAHKGREEHEGEHTSGAASFSFKVSASFGSTSTTKSPLQTIADAAAEGGWTMDISQENNAAAPGDWSDAEIVEDDPDAPAT